MDTAQITRTITNLIAIPSVADNTPALRASLAVIAGMLAGVPGITVEQLESNNKPSLLAYAGTVRPAAFTVLLHGHLDVVAGKAEQFTPRTVDGRLYGRGAADMKAAAVLMTDVFRRTATALPYALGLQMVTDEETGGYHGVRHQLHNGVRTNFAVTGEHNFHDNVIYNAARGICWIEVTFSGQTAHGAYVWHGDNAADKAARFAQAVMAHYPRPAGEVWATTANIASLHTANTTFNRIPDHASLRIDFRFTAEDPVFRSRDSVAAFVRSIDPQAAITSFEVMDPAVHVAESNPYVQRLAAALAQTTGQPIRFQSRPAASDGRHFAVLGMDAVEYGVTGHGPHSDNEYIELRSLKPYAATLEAFVTDPALPLTAKETQNESRTHRTIASQPARRHPHRDRAVAGQR